MELSGLEKDLVKLEADAQEDDAMIKKMMDQNEWATGVIEKYQKERRAAASAGAGSAAVGSTATGSAAASAVAGSAVAGSAASSAAAGLAAAGSAKNRKRAQSDKLSSAPAPTAAPAAAPAAPAHPAAIGRRKGKERAAAPAAAPAAPAHPAAIGGKQPAGIHNGAAGPSNGKRSLEPAAGPSATRPRLAAGVAARAAAGPSNANASPTAAPAAAEASIAALSPPPRALGPEDCGGCHLPVIWDRDQSSSDGRHKCNSCGRFVHAASYVCIAAGAKHTNLIASEGTFYCSVTCQLLESAYYAQ